MKQTYQMHWETHRIGFPTILTDDELKSLTGDRFSAARRCATSREGSIPLFAFDVKTGEIHGPYYSFEECKFRIQDKFSMDPLPHELPEFFDPTKIDPDTPYGTHLRNVTYRVYQFIEQCAAFFDAERPKYGHTAHGYQWYERLVLGLFRNYSAAGGDHAPIANSVLQNIPKLTQKPTAETPIALLSTVDSTRFQYTSLRQVLQTIVSGQFEKVPKHSRPSVCPCVSYATARGYKGLQTLSGIIAFDFDKVEDAPTLRKQLADLFEDRLVLSCVSPSGNGVKLWIANNSTLPVDYAIAYKEALDQVLAAGFPEPDSAQKHAAILCFTPADKDAIIGPYL